MKNEAMTKAKDIFGSQTQLAERLGVSQRSVSGWEQGTTVVPAEQAMRIERLTEGAVTLTDLRPDLSRLLAG